uniref:Inactive ubiquitin carboxyl-terminal hydrolase 54 n=1 Tax=Lygus hesperus TaxID=30085 RepID=A0A0A9YM75_LYGHE
MKDRTRSKKALFQITKVLWHLDIFRRSFRELSGHTCMLDSCIFCALKELFAQLQFSHESALPPDALRRALAESFFDQQRFQLGFMDDAAECFENILLRIHFHLACDEAEDLCSARHCIPHVKFAMTLVEQSVCGACGATSEPLPFTQMVHYVSASALISQARQAPSPTHPDLFGQLLKKAGGMGDIRDCPSACGAKIQIRRTLTNHPEIVSVGIVWDSDRPSLEHIMSLLMTLRTTLRLSDVFHTPPPLPTPSKSSHHLVGVVTYYGKHYSTFFFHTKLKIWIYFDDANVREVGPKWEQVVEKCRRGRYQPLLLLFAAPDGTPVDSSAAPKSTTVAQRALGMAKSPEQNGPAAQQARRSLTPSPEKPNLGALAQQRRALTPNPQQQPMDPHFQLQKQNGIISEYQNVSQMIQKGMPSPLSSPTRTGAGWNSQFGAVRRGMGGTELVRRDSGNWSGDRNSASSSSSTSLENPYQYIMGKMQTRGHIVPRSPTSLKGGESSSSGSQCDPGYDSYSLSSTDSLPLQQTLKHNLQLAQIPEGHQSPVLASLQLQHKSGQSECERLCEEADLLLQHSQATDDLQKALTFANAAVGKARQAMDAPYSNPQAASAARMKHNTCIMQARSLHKRLEEPNGPRHAEGRHSREGSGCSNRGSSGSHSRQGSRDKGNHSRQNSRELLTAAPAPEPAPVPEKPAEKTPEKSIEIYATLPKSRKGLLSRSSSKVKNTVEDEEYLMNDRPGRSLGRAKPPNGKKEEKRARSEERNKSSKEKEKEKETEKKASKEDGEGKKEDDKSWSEVDKDLSDLLHDEEATVEGAAEGGDDDQPGDDDEDSRQEGERYDRFKQSEKVDKEGGKTPAAQNGSLSTDEIKTIDPSTDEK